MWNIVGAAVAAAAVALLVSFGEPITQWSAVGLGAYAVFSWALTLRHRDRPTFTLIIGTPAFLCTVVAYGLNAFLSYAAGFWAPPYAMRDLGISPAEAGLILGGMGAVSGFLGVTVGGVVGDRLRQKHPGGRLIMVTLGAVLPAPFLAIGFTTETPIILYICLFLAQFTAAWALGTSAATTQDLVLPRMRGAATATYFIGTTLIGLAMGPYLAGRVSSLTGSLSTGVLSLLVTVPITLAAAIAAFKLVPAAEASREVRARAAGEPDLA